MSKIPYQRTAYKLGLF